MVNLLELSVGSGIAFDLHLDPKLGLFVGDPAQVQQVVMNLILNASDAFDGRGGRIRVRTCVHVVQPNEMQRWTGGERFVAGPCVMLEVHDDGCGMDAETLSQIFDPFFTTKFTGRGLGLSAVMGVVRSHSGAIHVESAPGRGSRFRVLFPLPHGPVSEPGRRRPAADGEPCVLAVDDDPTVLEATRQMLQSGGVKVYCAQTEAEAVDQFGRHAERIRLVILDVVMPDTTAGQIAARLEHIHGDVQILLTSGYSDSRLRPEIDARTIVGFLPKPYTRDELLEAVAEACPAIVHDLAEDAASA
jgi:CheY-like chemotaxis protein